MTKILITGQIGYEVTPDSVREQLATAKGGDIDIHIASPGGYVSDGIEIYNLIRDYKRENPKSEIMATLKGYAMSMASYIAMNPAIDMLVAEDNAVFMIHNVWGGTVGDYREMRKTADIFEGLTGIIAKAYTTKTKKSGKEIRQMMDDETWLFGAEMKEAGFVDDIIPSEAETEKPAAISEARAIFNTVAGRLTGQDIQKAVRGKHGIKKRGDDGRAALVDEVRQESPDQQVEATFVDCPAESQPAEDGRKRQDGLKREQVLPQCLQRHAQVPRLPRGEKWLDPMSKNHRSPPGGGKQHGSSANRKGVEHSRPGANQKHAEDETAQGGEKSHLRVTQHHQHT